MLNLVLLVPLAFWGDTQIKEWGEIEAHYAMGVPPCTRLDLVEFTLGIYHIGIGSTIVESYGFFNGKQLIGSILPIHITVPLYQRIGFWKDDAFFKQSVEFRLYGARWGQRYAGASPLSYLFEHDWEASAPYIGAEFIGRWSPVRMVGARGSMGLLIVKDAPERVYLTLGISIGTSGPISAQKIGPRLEIAGVVFDDRTSGNGDGVLDPNEHGRLVVLLVNRGLKDSDSVRLRAVVRDPQFESYVTLVETVVPPVAASRSIEVFLPVFAGSHLPALPLRIRVWGKDKDGNMVAPAPIEIPSAGS